MDRLKLALLDQVKSGISIPDYDRDQPISVVHLGTGAFHRAHQAVYFDSLMRQGHSGWMIQGASIRSAAVSEQLNPQDGLYTLITKNQSEADFTVIGSVRNVLVGPNDPDALIASIAERNVCLVTLTVTEKGYRPALAGGGLDMADLDVLHDIENPEGPRTALGFLSAGLFQRFLNGAGPMTILSCDNIPNNGDAARRGLLALASNRDVAFAAWVESNCAFPTSMVDRIVPATTNSDLAEFSLELGYQDSGMVKTESFSQWIVEDWFAGRRPPLESVGVQMTLDVEAWEKAKLRLLNGAHSAIAYLGYLAGYKFVHEVMEDSAFINFIDRLWDEAEKSLDPIDGFVAEFYRQQLRERFQNSALQHRTFQIAMDGSQKLPQRILNTIRWRRRQGLTSPALELGVAAWMRWQFGVDERGNSFIVDDPLAAKTKEIVDQSNNDPNMIAAGLIGLESIFGEDFIRQKDWVAQIGDALARLMKYGALQSVKIQAEPCA